MEYRELARADLSVWEAGFTCWGLLGRMESLSEGLS